MQGMSDFRTQRIQAALDRHRQYAAVEAERFDNEQPGILKFDCVLVADPARPL